MPANSGAISGTVAHKHSAPSGDGGYLDEGITGWQGGTLGEVIINDGTDVPVWSANTANPLIKVSKTFSDISGTTMDIYELPQDSALTNVFTDITTAFDLSTGVTIGDGSDDNGFVTAADFTAGTGLTNATRGNYVLNFKTMRSTSGTTAIKAYNFTTTGSAPAKDSQTVDDDSSNGTEITNAAFTVASNSNRVLIVSAARYGAGGDISGVTWNGGTEPFTRAVFDDDPLSGRTEIWFLVNPTATTADIVTTWNATTGRRGAGVYSYYNCDQTSPIGVTNSTNGVGTTTTGTITPTTTGSLIVDCEVSSSNVAATDTLTAGWTNLIGGTDRSFSSQYDLTPTISVSNDMFYSYPAPKGWSWSAAEVKPHVSGSDTQGAVDFYLQVVD